MSTRSVTTGRWSSGRVVRLLLALCSVGLFLRLAVQGADGVGHALRLLAVQQPGVAILLVCLVGARVLGLAQVQRASARYLGAALSLRDALRISTASFTLSRVVPGGGAAGGVFAIREFVRLGHPPGVAGGTALVSWAVTAVGLALVVSTGGAMALAEGLLPVTAVVGGVTFLVLLGVAGTAILVAVRSPRVRSWLVARLTPRSGGGSARIVTTIREARTTVASEVDALDTTGSARMAWAVPLAWAAGVFVVEVVTLATAFSVAGVAVTPGMVGAGFLAGATLNTVPELTPGWIGVYETAMAGTWVALGVEPAPALVAVLLHRLVAFWLPVTVGVVPAIRSLATRRRTSVARRRTSVARRRTSVTRRRTSVPRRRTSVARWRSGEVRRVDPDRPDRAGVPGVGAPATALGAAAGRGGAR